MVGTNPYHVVAVPRRSGRPPRSPAVRFIDFGRLYPGGGKQWSGPTPTLLWRCDVRSVGARSDRARCCLFRCALLRRSCVRAAASAVRAAASAVRACSSVCRSCLLLCRSCMMLRRACSLLCRACVQQRRLSVRARCCVCRAFVLLRRPCDAACRCVFRACVLPAASALHASVLLRRPCMLAAASVAHGPFHRFRTFIPRRWETMVGTNPYIVVALRRRSGRCTVCPCCLLPVP